MRFDNATYDGIVNRLIVGGTSNGEPVPGNWNLLVPWYLMSSYAYYEKDDPFLSDQCYDWICQQLDERWDAVEHMHKHIVDRAALKAGTGFQLAGKLPPMTKMAADHLTAKYDSPEEVGKMSAVDIDDLLGGSPEVRESKAQAPTAGDDDLVEKAKPGGEPGDGPAERNEDLVEKAKANPVEWMSRLDYNDDGGIRPTLPNMRLVVANDIRTRGVVAYNEFSEGLVRMAMPGKLHKKREGSGGTKQLTGQIWDRRDMVNGDLWKDVHDHAVRDLIETPGRMGGYGVKVSDRDLMAASSMAASDNLFHPVREYLDHRECDGKERV